MSEPPYIRINDLEMSDEKGRVVWKTDVDLLNPESGSYRAKVMVALDVDDEFDIVYADLSRAGDLAVLEQAIDTLERLRGAMTASYPEDLRQRGTCMEIDDEGKCGAVEDHDGPHRFEWPAHLPRPVDSDMRAAS